MGFASTGFDRLESALECGVFRGIGVGVPIGELGGCAAGGHGDDSADVSSVIDGVRFALVEL